MLRSSGEPWCRVLLPVALTMGCVLLAGGCTSKSDLYPQARCGDKALTDTKRDAPKIMSLAPEDVSAVEGRFSENPSLVYRAECYISDEDGDNFLTARVQYYDGKENAPGRSPKRFFAGSFKGVPRKVTSSSEGVGGVSGRDGAGVWAPCSTQKTTGFRPGAMVVTLSAPSAPDGDSAEQRQNAADLALSMLRYAVKHCDERPELPAKVKVAGRLSH